MGELRAPYAAYAHQSGVDQLLVVDHGERVALLKSEEVDGPLVDILHLCGQRIGQAVAHDRAPERRLYGRRAAASAYGDILLSRRDGHRVVRESEYHVIGDVFFVNQPVETSRRERVGREECRERASRPYLAQREYLGGGFVEFVDRHGRYSVTVEYFAERLAVAYFALFGTVIVGHDAVNERMLLLLGRFRLRRRRIFGVSACDEREQQQYYDYFCVCGHNLFSVTLRNSAVEKPRKFRTKLVKIYVSQGYKRSDDCKKRKKIVLALVNRK